MKVLLAAVSVIALVSTAAQAEKIKLTMNELVQINDGLSQINAGYKQVAKEGDREQVVKKTYEFASGTTLALVKDTVTVRHAVEPFFEKRNMIVQQAGKTVDKNDPASMAALVEQLKPLLDEEYELDLTLFKSSEFKLDKNPIPGDALVSISRLIQDDGK